MPLIPLIWVKTYTIHTQDYNCKWALFLVGFYCIYFLMKTHTCNQYSTPNLKKHQKNQNSFSLTQVHLNRHLRMLAELAILAVTNTSLDVLHRHITPVCEQVAFAFWIMTATVYMLIIWLMSYKESLTLFCWLEKWGINLTVIKKQDREPTDEAGKPKSE